MIERLDKRDKQLLMLLDTNATLPLSKLSANLNISKEAVSYRIKQLEKRGIIVNYITLSHFAKTGLTHFKMYIQYSNIGKADKHKILEYLSKNKNIGWLASTEGSFDLMLSVRFANIYDFEKFKDNFCAQFDKHFLAIQIAILTQAETKPRYYILPDARQENTRFLHCDEATVEILNKEDNLILGALAKNARVSANELAQQTGLTQRIIRYRRKDLEKRGIIVGYKLAIDYHKLGYLFFKCFVTFRSKTDSEYSRFRSYIRMHPNIIYWIKTIGSWDAELEIESPSVDEFYALISQIKDEFSSIILRIDSTLVSQEHEIKHA